MKTLVIRSGFALMMVTLFSISAVSQTTDEIRDKIVKINQQMAKAMMDGNASGHLGLLHKRCHFPSELWRNGEGHRCH